MPSQPLSYFSLGRCRGAARAGVYRGGAADGFDSHDRNTARAGVPTCGSVSFAAKPYLITKKHGGHTGNT